RGSEDGRGCLIAGRADRGDDLVGAGDGGVVIDLDAAGGELHAHVLDAREAADLLLDLGDTAGTAEARGAEDRVGDGSGGGGHDVRPSVSPGRVSLAVVSTYGEQSGADMMTIKRPPPSSGLRQHRPSGPRVDWTAWHPRTPPQATRRPRQGVAASPCARSPCPTSARAPYECTCWHGRPTSSACPRTSWTASTAAWRRSPGRRTIVSTRPASRPRPSTWWPR